MRRRIGLLIGLSLLCWLLAAYPARLLAGYTAVAYGGVAVVLCLVPAVLTLAWGGWALERSPEQQLVMVVGGTGFRMAFVLGAGLILYSAVPFFGQTAFWFWILVFYLVTLALEMVLLTAGRVPADDSTRFAGAALPGAPEQDAVKVR